MSSGEQEVLVWSVQELRALRESGLMGALVGCLPRAPRQNTRLGRPLLLLREEREEEEEQREKEQREKEEPRETQVQQWEEFLERSLEEQRRLAVKDRKCALMSSLSGAPLTSALAALDSFVFPRSALAVQISTCREGLPLPPIRSQHRGSEPIGEQLHGEGRVQVFRDLRRRGFCLTSGGKFGADFLVYPGDTLRFHAHFMALCVCEEEPLAVRDLLSWVRLSSNVKKTLLLCSASPSGGVLYSSLQWSSMS
ncbi:tRNA-splicing endonuclease subunit Sen34 [Periophthalmus magnuspinnatus]|uniref:tRNA-splicing endonuclease subunit Sen34 n=1 Tax=Periophthalmus magnuspinnatus TaxID=409849 RepID=UPI002436326B|nr:tRNA-splicing endonuclease subunit Sen34 [Periophthalmus magnuspinnatus]